MLHRPGRLPYPSAMTSIESPAPRAADQAAPPSVRLADVTAGYADRPAISDVSLDFRPGRLTAVFGPNGGGKSTLLKVIAGLLRPWSGEVSVLGAPPGEAARRVAYVPQAETVDWGFPVSAWDVAMMGRYPALGPLRRPRTEDRDAVAAALEQVGHGRPPRGPRSGRCRAASGGACSSPGRSRRRPTCTCSTSRSPGSTSRPRRTSSTCSRPRPRRGRTVIATTHDLACAASRFQDVVALNRVVVAHGPSSLVLDQDVLRRTYGGHLLVLGEQAILLDDAHHHDQPPGTEVHHHDDVPERR